jgi:hypothetical protein
MTLTKRRRSQTVIFSSDDEDECRKQTSHNSVWLAIYEEVPNISENEKKVLKLQTMNSFVIGVFTDVDSAQVACIRYVKNELDRPDIDFENVDWEEDGWFNDDLIDELDPYQRVYIMKHFVH